MSDSDDDGDDGLALLVGSSFARRAKPSQPPPLEEEQPIAAVKSNSLHEVTAEPSKGLGMQLAGTTNPVDDLWWSESIAWDASCASDTSSLPLPPPPLHAAHLEIRRFRHLIALRHTFRELCSAVPLSSHRPPINALERWRFSCKWQEDSAATADPLLPSGGSQPADVALGSDLTRAGLSTEAADELVAAIRSASCAAVADVCALRASLDNASTPPAALPALMCETHPGGVLRLRLDDSSNRASIGTATADGSSAATDAAAGAGAAGAGAAAGATEVSVRVTQAALNKLRTLHARHRPNETTSASTDATAEDAGAFTGAPADRWTDFDARVFAVLLRYEAIGGAGFQAALGGNVFRALQSSIATNFECFASPLNCYYGHYCSAFPDVDAPFGSRGSFTSFAPIRGSYEANPPFVDGIIDEMATRLLAHLERAEAANEPLCFTVVLPGWADNAGYCALLASPFLRRTLLVAAADHGYIDGAQHARPRAYRLSTYDTRIFVLQTATHLRDCPLTDEGMTRVETTLAECTPSADGHVRPRSQGDEEDEEEEDDCKDDKPGGGGEGAAASASGGGGSHAPLGGAVDARDAPACLRATHHRKKRRRKGGK